MSASCNDLTLARRTCSDLNGNPMPQTSAADHFCLPSSWQERGLGLNGFSNGEYQSPQRSQPATTAPMARMHNSRHSIARAAFAVSFEKDYSLRVTKRGQDEIGFLYDRFNEMMGRIQERETALRRAHDEVESRVKERTQELQKEVTERTQAEQELRESEARLRALVSSIDEIVFEFDGDGTYRNIWTTNEGLLFRPKKELLGRRIADIFRNDESGPLLEVLQRALKTGQGESYEYSLDVQSGKEWFLARVTPITSPEGDSKTLCMTSRSITERKRAEGELRRAKEAAEAASQSKSEFP